MYSIIKMEQPNQVKGAGNTHCKHSGAQVECLFTDMLAIVILDIDKVDLLEPVLGLGSPSSSPELGRRLS